MEASTPQPAEAKPPVAPLLVRIVLAVLAMNCLAWFFYANSNTDSYRLAYPRFQPWLWNMYLTTYLASLVGIFAVWSLRAWGFWLLVFLTVTMIAIEIFAMGFTTRILLAPAGLAALWFALQPHWKLLR